MKWVKQLDEFARKKYEDEDRGYENIMLANMARDEAYEERRNDLIHGICLPKDAISMSILMESRASLLNDKCAGVDRVVAELLWKLFRGEVSASFENTSTNGTRELLVVRHRIGSSYESRSS